MKKQISIIVICLMSLFTSTAQTWSAVGSGLNGTVNSLYSDPTSDRLYATGAFTASMNDGSASVNPSGGTSPYTYSWSPSGQTTQTATGLTGGVYNCTITDNNGCATIKTVTVTTTITTGVSSYTLPIGISIYPNPSNGQFTIDAGDATINVFDCLGKQICLHFTINSKQSINLNKPGMYLIQVIKDGKVYNSRLINQ